MAVGKNITWKKGKVGSNMIFPIILELLVRISRGEKGRGQKFRGRKSKF